MAKAKEPTDNRRIWDALGKTDPSHTKQFTRSGGFRGTAIKPMWANRRMTEFFGPCGIGWGQTEPQFQTISAEGEILVYCTVGLWYMESARGQTVYGVGGDKVLTQIFEKDRQGNKIKDEATGRFKTYPQTDDEAFKKAYTDALSNAMKFIGVGADVHMGLFDDSKYVQSMKEEFKDAVEDEVAAQKAGAEPPPIEFQYSQKILICRPINAELRKKGEKEFYAVKLNGKIADKAQLIFCWHKSMFPMLAMVTGKLCRFALDGAGDFFNIEDIYEVDGVKWEKPVDINNSTELKARTAGSILGLTDKELLTVLKMANGDWQVTLDRINEQIAKQKEEAPA